MTILDVKLKRDLILSMRLLLAVVAIIAVGTGSFVGMLGTYNNLEEAKSSYYSQCRMADFWIDLKKAPVSEALRLCDFEGVSEVRDRITFPVVVDLEGVDTPIGGLAISMPETFKPVINNLVIRRGSYFSDERPNEVILSEKFANAREIPIGTYMHAILNGQKKKLFVVGTAISSEHTYLAPPGGMVDDPMQYGVLYIKQSYAEDVFGFQGACNNLVGILTPDARENDTHGVLSELSKRLSDYGVFTVTPLKQQFSNLTLSSEMSGLQTMATMFPALFLGVAALVLNVLMTRMAEQQRTIVGTIKALGYNNRQVFVHFLQFGLIVGVVGGLAGCALGYWISGGMTGMYVQFFEFPKLTNNAYISLMVIAVLISVVFAVLGTLRGVRKVVDLNPAEAMHPPAPPACGGIALERCHAIWSRLDFRWQMILRGMFRNKGRTIVGILAAALGSSLVVMAFGFVNSMTAMINFQFDKVLLSDYTIVLKDECDYGALLEVQNMPGISEAEPTFNVACTFRFGSHSKKGAITGLQPGAKMVVPCNKDGEVVDVPPSGLLMTRRLANELGVKAGEYIEFVSIKGERRPHRVKVVKLIENMLGLSVYANYDWLNRLMGESGAISEVQVRTAQTPAEKKSFLRGLKQLPKLESLGDVNRQKAMLTKQFNGAMLSMAFFMILFAGVIFFGSILNGSLISISERQREIATFRVLGYHPREVSEIMLRENMVMNMIGTVLGLPLGYGLLYNMMLQYQNDAYSMPAVIYTQTWVYTVALAILFVLGAQWVIHRNITKLQWQEALSMKE